MNEYIINNKTMAILPYEKNKSIVYEEKRFYIVKKTPINIIKRSCLAYGSSFEGRLNGTLELTGYKYKAPIIINGINNIIFFPTESNRLKTTEWISLNHVDKYYNTPLKNSTYIIFNNGKTMEFKKSLNIIQGQILRSTHLSSFIYKNSVKN